MTFIVSLEATVCCCCFCCYCYSDCYYLMMIHYNYPNAAFDGGSMVFCLVCLYISRWKGRTEIAPVLKTLGTVSDGV
jgi:hypothetical protein